MLTETNNRYIAELVIDDSHLPVVTTKAGEVTIPLTVDIGGMGIMIDLEFATETGLFHHDMEHKTAKARGVGGEEMNVYLIELEQFEFANKVVHDIQIGVMDFKNLKAGNVMTHSKGIIGYQFFRDYQLILDYSQRVIELRDPGTEILGQVHDLEFMSHHLIKVPVEVGGKELSMVLDSGAGGFVLNKSVVDEMGWEFTLSGEKSRGIGGEVTAWEMDLNEFGVYEEKYPCQTVRILELGEFYQGGVIGYSLLQYARLVVDYPRGKISLTKSS